MTSDDKPYRKLPGVGLTWSGRGKLWLAADHLLETTSIMITENYRRFYFHEIRAFVVRRTGAQVIWAWISGVSTFLSFAFGAWAFWAARADSMSDLKVFSYFVAGALAGVGLVFLILSVINFLRGPTCCCHVMTKTGWHALNAPLRAKTAVRVEMELIPLIENAQFENRPAETEAQS